MGRHLLAIVLLVLLLAGQSLGEPQRRGDSSRPGATALASQLCGKDRRCCGVAETAAGTDHAGHALTVVRLDRACGGKAKSSDGAGASEVCQPYQNWLVVTDREGKLRARQLLTVECNDGYGAAGVGEDSTQTEALRFIHSRNGGSAWRWSTDVEIGLDPPRITKESWSGFWTLGEDNRGEGQWNWEAFAGDGTESVPRCGENGEASADSAQDTKPPPPIERAYVVIPQVSLPTTFVAGEWQRLGLGRCSARVDGKATGFRVHGKPGKDEDSRFAVVATEVDKQLLLFVEIWDDRWVGPTPENTGERWLFDDHLELWLSGLVTYSSHCTNKQDGAPEQWAIRITDGQVFAAMGATKGMPTVERVLGADGVARLKIALPAGKVHDNIALVYSDSDDGKRQKRLIATSQVKLGWAASLGALQLISPDAASCVVGRGQLEPVLATPRRDPDQPLWGM